MKLSAELRTLASLILFGLASANEDDASQCAAAGGTWYAERNYCYFAPPPSPQNADEPGAERCAATGGTWYPDREYCYFPSPAPPPSRLIKHPGLLLSIIAGPAGPVGGPPMCCMAYNFQCLSCSMGVVGAAMTLWGKQIVAAFTAAFITPAGPISAPRMCCRAYTFECLRCEHGVFRALLMIMIGI